MSAFVDRTGRRYGRLLVSTYVETVNHRTHWLCRCDCGAETVVMGSALGFSTFSCGCFGIERKRAKGKNATHGKSKSREYGIWQGMRSRCHKPSDDAYRNYGGRGIYVCPEWSTFERFIADMGPCPAGYEIDRIDVDGNYTPSNCRWTDLVTQANNRRCNQRLLDGRTVAEFARDVGLKYGTAYARVVLRGQRDGAMAQRRPSELVWGDEE